MNILELFRNQAKFKTVMQQITNTPNQQNIYVGNCGTNVSKMLAAGSYLEKPQNIVYVCANIYEASKAYEAFCDLLGTDYVSFFPVEEFISSELVASSITFRLARMLSIYHILQQNPKIIVTNVEGVTRNMMSKAKIAASMVVLKVGTIIEMSDLIDELITRGYKKTSVTTEMGTFSIRGSLIDVFPINEQTALRISFFDNEIEAIKAIDIETQRSMDHRAEVVIFPLYEMYYPESEVASIHQRILGHNQKTAKIEKDFFSLENYQNLDQLYIYLPDIDPDYQSFLTLIDDPICFFEDYSELLEHEKANNLEIGEYLMQVNYHLPQQFFASLTSVLAYSKVNVFTNLFMSSFHHIFLHQLVDLKTGNNLEYNNNLRALMEDLRINHHKTYIITHQDEKKLAFLKETFTANQLPFEILKRYRDIEPGKLYLAVMENGYGYIDYETMLEIITPNEFAPGKILRHAKYQKFQNHTTKIYNKEELNVGDYVVHQDYGIARYIGIKTIELRGVRNDYLGLEYANDSKLYVPVENIYVLEKYIGSKEQTPKLNNINGKEWQKKKARVKEKVKEVAQKLIKVQAEREAQQGYIYQTDSVSQLEFENDFGFTETKDQLQAIHDVKQDMEGTRPLDRLICGDVGFGKTEVAMRAAFKAVDNAKQVAYLAPTTVLTRQHFYTFKDRFEKYGIRVELLNRFVDVSKQKIVIEGIKKGYVDIVIGTHRLLSNDIQFKDLGMLIVDEEQRFGVEHKEKIKQMKSLVDVLTLTATPIPRTLQMALAGLRDLSLIETPPINRLPIQTYVLESNDSVIREAINREMGRGGQVFYLLNRISELERMVRKVRKLVPKARVGMIHGQMDKDLIEEELNRFLDRNYDVLLCTTIIETGIDIPNANTLIIERADILGLSQLYQIRGRVGRSDRISYAYLMYEPDKVITENAAKRLLAIKEFTALGSGYKIAMRDLAIRGAGDILGSEQSGFIDAIGMDLYMKMLNEAVTEAKGIQADDTMEKRYQIAVSRHIDQSYVDEDSIRIEMHQSISKIKSREQMKLLISEYTDRYGKLNEEILLYMEEKYLEFLLKAKGIESFKEQDDEVVLNFDELTTNKLNSKALFDLSYQFAPTFYFEYHKKRIFIKIKMKDYPKSYIYTLTKFLEAVQF